MGRLIPIRPRSRTLYVLEETIASLHEELQLTLNYAQAMVRDKNYRAAAEVIEEQRRSLARATTRMEKAIAPEAPVRRKARVRAALVGVAATMALASGAFAAFGPSAPKPDASGRRIEAIQRTTEALSAAQTITDPLALQQIVGEANDQIRAVASLNPTDLQLQLSLRDAVLSLESVINNPQLPQSVREEARRVAEEVHDIVLDTADETRETESKTTSKTTTPDTETETKTTQTSAPAAEPSV